MIAMDGMHILSILIWTLKWGAWSYSSGYVIGNALNDTDKITSYYTFDCNTKIYIRADP
jgi:hypothetical protein